MGRFDASPDGSANDATPSSVLAAKLREAYSEQLSANQASMFNYVNTVAGVCESFIGNLDGPLIAAALRGTDKSSGADAPALRGTDKPSGADGTTLVANTALCREDGPLVVHSVSAGWSRTDVTQSSDGITIPDNVLEDSAVPKFSFFNDDGSIGYPETRLHRMLGPKYTAVDKGFRSMLSGWRPIGGPIGLMVHSHIYNVMSAVVIVGNFFFIVVQSDFKVANLHTDETASMKVIGHLFTAWYTFELICNMVAHGKLFILGPDLGWNLFDFGIVAVSWFGIIIESLGGNAGNTSFIRIIRFMRISRVLRMFAAMRLFKEIKIMVDGLAGSLSIFFFCSLMLALFLSLFAVFFVQGLSTYLENEPDVDPLWSRDVHAKFGTVAQAMLSLFICVTGGDDWNMYLELIRVIGSQYTFLFLVFVDFYMFAFVNVIVGVFCEKASALATPTTHELMHKRYEKEFSDAIELFELLEQHLVQEGSTRYITADQFKQFIADHEVEKYFDVRGLKASSALRFFRMLCDLYHTDKIDYPTFISAVVSLDGQASCIDLHVLSVRQLHGIHQINSIMATQHKEVIKVQDELSKSQSHLQDLKDGMLMNTTTAPRSSPRSSQISESNALVATTLSAIEAEIRDLKAMAARSPRPPSPRFVPAAPNVNNVGSASSPNNTDSTQCSASEVATRLETPYASEAQDLTSRLNSLSLHGTEARVTHAETSMTEKSETSRRESSEALIRSEAELQAMKLKNEQFLRLLELHDAREIEMHRQLSHQRKGHETELRNSERSMEDVQIQALQAGEAFRQRILELEAQLSSARSSDARSQLAAAQMRGTPRSNASMFDWSCAPMDDSCGKRPRARADV